MNVASTTIRDNDTAGGRLVWTDERGSVRIRAWEIGPARPPNPSRVLDAVYALATELRRLGAESKAELFEGLACCSKRGQLAAPALIVAGVLERQSNGHVRSELAAGRASIEHAAGTRRRDVRVDGEHLGTAEQDSAGDWHGHLSETNGGSTVIANFGGAYSALATRPEEVLVRTMLECADRHWAFVAKKAAATR